MKIKLLSLCMSFGVFAETVDDKYVLSLPNQLYKNSIVIVESNGGFNS